jgi:hypothetical protein
MIHFGQRLIEQGEDFHDLTKVFQNVERPLYSDNCCHLNKDGYLLIVDKLVEILSKGGFYASLRREGQCVPRQIDGKVST